ncbi:unnamed protein product [Mytilus edulis]|uniref:TRPM SLOG domain-containing protein n=1 Tax=Mytilus edulis TaxID=6550 RepID=A0A8S3U6H6_MYTED|nr:unnamed protein product [Mytilus edulis]
MTNLLLPTTRYKEIQVTQSKIRKDDLSEIYSTLRRSVYVATKGHDNSLPGLVLAVIGDSESYVPKPWNTTAFTSGLLQSIQGVKKSWVIYRGNKDGVSALIHNAFRETADTNLATTQRNALNAKIKGNTLIAIRPWTKMDQEGNNKVKEPDLILSIRPVFKDVQKERKYRWFNRYLSHFLKTLSEEYTPLLSKEKGQEGELALINMRVPVLMIAVEGDISTIHQIKSALRRNVPVLLTKGSGRHEKEKVLKENAPLLLGIYMRSEEYTKLKRRLKIIQKHSHIITIFDLKQQTKLQAEDFVVKAIIKGWSLKEIRNSSANSNDKKKISVVMNNVEIERAAGCLMEHFHVAPGSLSLYFYIAYQYILESCEIENKEKELELFLLEAIIANRVDYVSTLIQHGVTFDRNYMCRLFDEDVDLVAAPVAVQISRENVVDFTIPITMTLQLFC